MKKIISLITASILSLGILAGCGTASGKTTTAASSATGLTKMQDYFFEVDGVEVFNTIITLMAYEKDEATFNGYVDQAKTSFLYYHKLFDIYHTYEGMNNIKTVNDQAGKAPVKVDAPLIELIKQARAYYETTGRETNIAMGAVLRIWHDYRDKYDNKGEGDAIPSMAELQAANQHVNLDDILIDEAASTIYLKDPEMSLDLGAFAKGFATEKVVAELRQAGMKYALISAGGNIKIIGAPIEAGKTKWGIGIQDPFGGAEGYIETLFLDKGSVVSSGDYERYYTYQGKRMHHIIDPKTLMPADYFSQVSILTEDSALADFMSTTLYLLPYEDGYKMAQEMGLEVMWVFKDKSIKTTPGLEKVMKSLGATSK